MKFLEFTKLEQNAILLLCALTLITAVIVRTTIKTSNSKISTTLTNPDTLNIQKSDTIIKIDPKDPENLILYKF